MKKLWNEYKVEFIGFMICTVFAFGCYTFINNTWYWHMGLIVDKANAEIHHK